MNKRIKSIMFIVIGVISGLLLLHLTVNNLIPIIKRMHGM